MMTCKEAVELIHSVIETELLPPEMERSLMELADAVCEDSLDYKDECGECPSLALPPYI